MDSLKTTNDFNEEPLLKGGILHFKPVTEQDLRRFRAQEQQLSCWYDPHQGHLLDGFVLTVEDRDVGMLNLVTCLNHLKAGERQAYARIDLVIVKKQWRSFGFARLLISLGVFSILKSFPNQIYSISCLAAHPTIEKTLMDRGFLCERRDNQEYVHCSREITDDQFEDFFLDAQHQLQADLRKAVFRMRQNQEHIKTIVG